jgi:hypothetical protein
MWRGFVFGIILSALFWGAPPALAKGPFGSIKIGQWTGGAYTDDKTGSFSHCAAGAPYLNGISVVVSKNVQDQWTLAFISPSFNLTPGETIPIDVTFDGKSHVRLFGAVLIPEMVGAPLPSDALLRKSHLMVAEANGATYQFQLKSLDRVMATVEHCVSKTKTAGVSNAGDFSATVAKPVVQTTPAAGSPPAPKSAKTVGRTGTGFLVSTSGHVTIM